MWILECDGDILNGKRVWLRPGKTYLFGRTKPENGRHAGFTISHKSVSRKHLTLSVSDVKPGNGSQVYTRSELGLEDAGTKIGTELDGERLTGGKSILDGEEHVFKLGSYESLFRIKWQPVVLSFTFPSKEFKKGRDPLAPVRARLEELDIKTVIPYIVDKTTHVVAGKRNTAKGLQALINGKYIVDNSFMDALVYATTPGNLDEPESQCPLEEDYDKNWPNALDHLPPQSKEPVSRSAEAFIPNPLRKEIFEGYTFVFCDQTQFETLQPPISNGGGKALHFVLDMGNTLAEDVVRYVKNVAGEKGVGEFEDGSEGKGVVVAKFGGAKGFEDWAAELQQQIALALDQRSIELNEFLEAILKIDASKLRRTLPEDTGDTVYNTQVNGPSSAHDRTTNGQTSSTKPETSQPSSRRGRTRGPIVSQFKGFGDGLDISVVSTQKKIIDGTPNGLSNGTSQHSSRAVSFAGPAMDAEPPDVNEDVSLAQGIRKRPPPSDDEDEDSMTESILPAAAAMKRRRIEEEKEARQRGVSLGTPSEHAQKRVGAPVRKARQPKEVDIKEVVRERREAEDEAARQQQDALKGTLEGMNVEEMRNLAVVEEMEVKERSSRPSRREDGNSDRWDECWNGRRNFKKFRRRDEVQPTRRGQTVMVPLEEVRKKVYGIGEDYWLESEKTRKKRKEKERERVSQSQSQAVSNGSSTAKTVSEHVIPPELMTNGETPEAVDVDAPRRTRLMEQTLSFREQPTQGTNQSSTQNTTTNTKRPADTSSTGTGTGTNGPATKRPKLLPPTRKLASKTPLLPEPDSDSDSEDELKFRFKRR